MSDVVQVTIPRETVNDESVLILAWRVASGSIVLKDELICEAETSKAVMEIHAPTAGTLIHQADVGDEVPIGAPIGRIVEVTSDLHPTNASAPEADGQSVGTPGPARLTPSARKTAAEYGIDVASFEPGTLVRREDVLSRAGVVISPSPRRVDIPDPKGPARALPPVGNIPVAGVEIEWTDLTRRKTVENRILAAAHASTLPSAVTSVCRAPMLRERGARLGFSYVALDALIVFETARLLRRYPVFNAVYDGNRLGLYRDVNVGWAIDGGQKLVVPVISHADQKSLVDIAGQMEKQLESYVSDSFTTAELFGGTFTIANLSADSVSFFHPLMSEGQSAILGVGSERRHPEGETFYLTLVFDHQIAEGRTAASFLRDLTARLEAHSAVLDNPARANEPYCVLCQRDAGALARVQAILLRSEIPAGFVCSLCVAGLA